MSATPGYSTDPPTAISQWFPLVTVDIPIETAGKRGHRVAQARQLSQSARWDRVTTAWDVRRKLTGALLDYAAAHARGSVLQRQLDLQDHIVRLLEGELVAGAIAGSDVTVARVQRAKTRLDLEAIRAQVTDARSRTAQGARHSAARLGRCGTGLWI